MNTDSRKFFKEHCIIQKRENSFFGTDFRELFMWMVKEDPIKRATIQDVKSSRWYKGSIYTARELALIVRSFTEY